MSSVNISIREDVYEKLKRLKKEDESFSDVIEHLTENKDITRCFGLFGGDEENIAIIRKEAEKARKQRWKEVRL